MMNNNLVNCKVGDIVRFYFELHENKQDVIGEILKIEERYVKHNEGTLRANPLITYVQINSDNKEKKYCDQAYITEVIISSKAIPRKLNIYKKLESEKYIEFKKRTIVGNFYELCEYCISKIENKKIDRPLDRESFLLWKKNGFPGRICNSLELGFTEVRKKPFKKWVHKNIDRILKTVKETTKENTEIEMSFENDYWEDYRESVEKI